MRMRLILVAALALAGLPGCRVFEKLTKEKSPAEPASRSKDKDKDRDWLKERQSREPGEPPKDWLAGPATKGRGDRVPPAENWADPASRGFDSRAATSRILSGNLEDADGRPSCPTLTSPWRTPTPSRRATAIPMGVESDKDGFFEINGLTAGEHYMLTAQAKGNGKNQAGRVSVQVPNTKIRLRLMDDYVLPNRTRDASDLPPSVPSGNRLPKLFDTPSAGETPSGDWSPVPKSNENPRGDLVAPGPQPDWRPPAANIPGPTAPSIPSPTGPISKALPRTNTVQALGDDGRIKSLLSGRAEDLVLLDFLTTTCGPCKKAIPALVAFQDKYGKRVEVIGVLCDNDSDSRRVSLARRYQADQRLPTQWSPRATSSRCRTSSTCSRIPRWCCSTAQARRLWKGHPKESQRSGTDRPQSLSAAVTSPSRRSSTSRSGRGCRACR